MSNVGRRIGGRVLAGLVLIGGAGCDAPKPTRPATPAEAFRAEQAETRTPHDRVLADTAEDRDGRIEYRTADGRRWRVEATRAADGSYRYGTPEELPPDPATAAPGARK